MIKRRRRSVSNPVPSLAELGDDQASPGEALALESGEEGDEEPAASDPAAPVTPAAPAAPPEAVTGELPVWPCAEPLPTLAATLRGRRLALGLSVSELARLTHLSQRTINRIEEEPLEGQDAPFYVKNRLRLYARLVRLDPDATVRFYEQALQSRITERAAAAAHGTPLRHYLPYLVGGGAVLVVLVVIWLW